MAGLEHRHVRSALEFAVLIAAEGQKRKPALEYPSVLKQYFGANRLPNSALGKVRRAIDDDQRFRTRLAAGALPELVDDIGRLWLERPTGWEARAIELARAADAAAESESLAAQLKSADRRRQAAEQAAARGRAELLRLDEVVAMQSTEIDTLRAEVAKAEDNLEEMRIELVDVRMDVRHARDREQAAKSKATATQERLDEALTALADLEERRDGPASGSAVIHGGPDDDLAESVDAAELGRVAAEARALVERIEELLPRARESAPVAAPSEPAARPVRRTPLALPGGVIGSSAEAAGHLARSDAQFLIDGYNVAKSGWPNRPLERQRAALLDAVENLSRRFGTDATVVFDGADVVGAHTTRRQLVRVVYSPAGVTADDVIRDEVRRLPTSRLVVVVTNDAEIVRDVRADGANVVPSNALLAIF